MALLYFIFLRLFFFSKKKVLPNPLLKVPSLQHKIIFLTLNNFDAVNDTENRTKNVIRVSPSLPSLPSSIVDKVNLY